MAYYSKIEHLVGLDLLLEERNVTAEVVFKLGLGWLFFFGIA